jgi:hypothetical protein
MKDMVDLVTCVPGKNTGIGSTTLMKLRKNSQRDGDGTKKIL